MNIIKILADLRAEKTAIDEAIVVLERLAGGRPGRRSGVSGAPRSRRPFSEDTKRKMAASQKKRWAAYRKAQKENAKE